MLTTQVFQPFISSNLPNEAFSSDRELLTTKHDLKKIIIKFEIQMKGVTRIFVL